jgi:hypothetical protein
LLDFVTRELEISATSAIPGDPLDVSERTSASTRGSGSAPGGVEFVGDLDMWSVGQHAKAEVAAPVAEVTTETAGE